MPRVRLPSPPVRGNPAHAGAVRAMRGVQVQVAGRGDTPADRPHVWCAARRARRGRHGADRSSAARRVRASRHRTADAGSAGCSPPRRRLLRSVRRGAGERRCGRGGRRDPERSPPELPPDAGRRSTARRPVIEAARAVADPLRRVGTQRADRGASRPYGTASRRRGGRGRAHLRAQVSGVLDGLRGVVHPDAAGPGRRRAHQRPAR